MSITINEREQAGVKIFDLVGRITLGSGNVELRESINKALDAGDKKLLLNLAELSYLDSAGVGALVGCFTSAQSRGASLKLVNLTKKIHDVLAITKLITVFDTFESESEAINSF
ncbi:MAG: STAS domain-containing protein [Acidobacteriota bacterium]